MDDIRYVPGIILNTKWVLTALRGRYHFCLTDEDIDVKEIAPGHKARKC